MIILHSPADEPVSLLLKRIGITFPKAPVSRGNGIQVAQYPDRSTRISARKQARIFGRFLKGPGVRTRKGDHPEGSRP